MKKFVHIDIEKFKENYRKVRRILSKVYEIYHMIMIFCFCVVIDMILVGIFIVWPLLWIIDLLTEINQINNINEMVIISRNS